MESLFTMYEEMMADVTIYDDKDDLNQINYSLICNSKKGVIIVGNKGTGKTAYVRRFLQQDLSDTLDVESAKVIQIYEEYLSKCKNDEETAQCFLSLCQKYENTAIILYMKFNNEAMLNATTRIFERCSEKIQKMCNMPMLKSIFEFTTEQVDQEYEKFSNKFSNSFDIIPVYIPFQFEDLLKIVKTMVKNLSNIYKVSATNKTIFYALVIVYGLVGEFENLNYYYSCFERLFAITRKKGKKIVGMNMVKYEFNNVFEKLQKTSYCNLLQTAYHECGHALFVLLASNAFCLDYITVIPGRNFKGVTVYSSSKRNNDVIETREYAIMLIAKSLAGREAEGLYTQNNKTNSGATTDLRKVDEIVNKLILKTGASKTLGTNCILANEKLISESAKKGIEREKAEIIEKATYKAFMEIKKHKAFIVKLAETLAKNLLLSGTDVQKMWNEYLEEKEEEKKQKQNK